MKFNLFKFYNQCHWIQIRIEWHQCRFDRVSKATNVFNCIRNYCCSFFWLVSSPSPSSSSSPLLLLPPKSRIAFGSVNVGDRIVTVFMCVCLVCLLIVELKAIEWLVNRMHLNYSNMFGENYRNQWQGKVSVREGMRKGERNTKKTHIHGSIVQSMHCADIHTHTLIGSHRYTKRPING